jgi:hypothetical protein
MRRVVLLASLALVVGALVPASAQPAAGGSDLPFKGVQSGYGTTNLVTGQAHLVTAGPWSHFGLSIVEQDLQLVFTGPGVFTSSGTWTVTAANGDRMFGTVTGVGSFTDAVHSTTLVNAVSTGGTGRFANASLSFSATVYGTRVSLEGAVATTFFEGTGVGRLSYR